MNNLVNKTRKKVYYHFN